MDAVAAGDAAEADAGFLPRFLGAVCGGGGSSCSDFLFLPGRDLGTRVGDTTCRGITTSTLKSQIIKLVLSRDLNCYGKNVIMN